MRKKKVWKIIFSNLQSKISDILMAKKTIIGIQTKTTRNALEK